MTSGIETEHNSTLKSRGMWSEGDVKLEIQFCTVSPTNILYTSPSHNAPIETGLPPLFTQRVQYTHTNKCVQQ